MTKTFAVVRLKEDTTLSIWRSQLFADQGEAKIVCANLPEKEHWRVESCFIIFPNID